MSKTVKIDYQGISIECQSTCEEASNRLCELNRILERLREGSQKLVNQQTKDLKKELLSIRQQILDQIDIVVATAKANSDKYGTVYTDLDLDARHSGAKDPIYEARKLRKMANNLLTTRLTEMEALLNDLMGERLEKNTSEMYDRAFGVANVDGLFMQSLNNVNDAVLKQYIYLEWLKDDSLPFEQLHRLGAEQMDKRTSDTFTRKKEQELTKIRKELKEYRIAPEVIEKVMDVDAGSAQEQIEAVRERATEEIVNEKVRKETVKIIKKAIEARGFIVSRGAVKYQRDTDEVVIVAVKPNREKAEFRISLNGRFVYHFNGYKGQACKNDIEPFMSDLEKVYGIKVIKSEEIWSNPDKISTQKYQTINVDHNRR